eukprot:1422196-Prymnesium_polylepis.1
MRAGQSAYSSTWPYQCTDPMSRGRCPELWQEAGFPFRSVPFRNGTTFRSVLVGPAPPVLHSPHTPSEVATPT